MTPLSLFVFFGDFKMHHVTEANQTIVRTLAAAGIRHEDIATKIGISQDTLVRKYRRELDDGRIDATSEMATSLFNAGKNGNIPAAIFWLKSRAGWSDRSQIELTGENGGPIKVDTTVFDAIITNLESKRQLEDQ